MAFRRRGSRLNFSSESGSRVIFNVDLAVGSPDRNIFIADAPYRVRAISESHSVVSTSGTARVRKITDTSAPGAAASSTVLELHTANFDLSAGVAINTSTDATLALALADLQLADGDKIAVNMGGTLTGLVGTITIQLERE